MAIDPSLGDVFAVGAAIQAGATRDELRATRLGRPFYGVRSRASVPLARAYAPRLRPGDRFSHTTAALIWGAPLSRVLEAQLHVSAARGQRPRAIGCIGHVTSTTESMVRTGLPISSPAQTVVECATMMSIDELVALCDYFVLDPRVLDPRDLRPYITRVELGERLRGLRGLGVRAARRAHALCRDGVESPMETALRLLLLHAGLPEPQCGYELTRRDGSSVGWFDLAWPDHRVIAEYDGDQHRTSTTQYERDIRRFDEAADLGWRVIRVRQHGILRSPESTIERVARVLN